MTYNIELSPTFVKAAKRLAKKYPSLKSDLVTVFEVLEKDPKQGQNLGGNVYKIRFAIASKSKGKSGGGRIICYVQVSESVVLLLTLYDKGDRETISDKEIKDLLNKYL